MNQANSKLVLIGIANVFHYVISSINLTNIFTRIACKTTFLMLIFPSPGLFKFWLVSHKSEEYDWLRIRLKSKPGDLSSFENSSPTVQYYVHILCLLQCFSDSWCQGTDSALHGVLPESTSRGISDSEDDTEDYVMDLWHESSRRPAGFLNNNNSNSTY